MDRGGRGGRGGDFRGGRGGDSRGGRGGGDFRGGRGGGRGRGGPPRYTGPILTEKRPAAPEPKLRSGAGAIVPFEDPLQQKPFGKLGQQFKVAVNHFRIKSIPNDVIFVYDVQLDPGATRRVGALLAKKLWNHPEVQAKIGKYKSLLFNGMNLAWSYEEIDQFRVTFDLGGGRDGRPDEHTVGMRTAGRVNMQMLIEFLGHHYGPMDHLGRSLRDSDYAQAVNVLDMILRVGASKQFFPRRSTFFDPSKREALDSFLEIWHGFFQSVRPNFGNLTINFDKAVGVFWIPNRSMVESAVDLMRMDPSTLIRRQREPSLRTEWNKMKGLEFYCKHLKLKQGQTKPKVFKVASFSSKGADQEFFDQDGRQISVADYFKKQYNINLKYPGLRCAQNKKGNKFPLEVCFISENQPFKTLVSPDQMAKMILTTTNRPPLRHRDIMGHVDKINWNEDPTLKEYGMTVDNDFLEVPARVMPLPKLQYGRDTLIPDKGQWNLRGQRLVDPMKLTSWCVAGCVSPQESASVANFVQECMKNWGSLGLDVVRKPPPTQFLDPNGNLQSQIENLVRQAGNTFNKAPDLILFIVRDKKVEPYRSLKRILDTRLNLPSQGVMLKHVQKASPQYCANVGMKVNAKLGGSSVRLMDASNPVLSKGSYMVMGADTAHPPPGAVDSPTIAAVTASNDKHATRFTSVVRSQDSRVELIKDFAEMAKELLQRFKAINNMYPQSIYYFRDGVSEGQYQQVLDEEVAGLKTAFSDLGINPLPKVTVSIFGKRHHTRIWPREMGIAHEDTGGNVYPGTIVENNNGFDFYLVPHKALQGTARPAHVEVILNETNIPVDAFQAFVFNISHVFARSTTSVSLVPPVYYAHLTCERARAHVQLTEDTASTVSGSSGERPPVQPLIGLGSRVSKVAWFM